MLTSGTPLNSFSSSLPCPLLPRLALDIGYRLECVNSYHIQGMNAMSMIEDKARWMRGRLTKKVRQHKGSSLVATTTTYSASPLKRVCPPISSTIEGISTRPSIVFSAINNSLLRVAAVQIGRTGEEEGGANHHTNADHKRSLTNHTPSSTPSLNY